MMTWSYKRHTMFIVQFLFYVCVGDSTLSDLLMSHFLETPELEIRFLITFLFVIVDMFGLVPLHTEFKSASFDLISVLWVEKQARWTKTALNANFNYNFQNCSRVLYEHINTRYQISYSYLISGCHYPSYIQMSTMDGLNVENDILFPEPMKREGQNCLWLLNLPFVLWENKISVKVIFLGWCWVITIIAPIGRVFFNSIRYSVCCQLRNYRRP